MTLPSEHESPDASVKPSAPPRGSRKHVLDWVVSLGFRDELNAMIAPSGIQVQAGDRFVPTGLPGKGGALEARLERFLLDLAMRAELQRWWLAVPRGANTPNWELAVQTQHQGRLALVLVEAKAIVPELSEAGKGLAAGKDSQAPSPNSSLNHLRIAEAIAEANTGLNGVATGFNLSRDKHYQLSNRLAFSWKLASMGGPTVLLYLGFTGDQGLEPELAMLPDSTSWEKLFKGHAEAVMPTDVLGRWLGIGAAGLLVLVAARERLEDSPPVLARGATGGTGPA